MDAPELTFNRHEEYGRTLAKLKEEFMSRWNDDKPSPQAGLDDLETITVLGSGGFGTVKLCRGKTTNQIYAVKFLRKGFIVKHKQIKNVCNEKRVLKSIRFPFVVNLEFSRKDNDFLYLGMPFVNGGEVYTHHKKVRKYNEPASKFYASQVFLALEYLHTLQLIYRDLKPENLLFDNRGYIKLTDFGFTKRVEKRTLTLCGTPEYLAPEIIQSKAYGNSVDWWAFGVLIYEFVSGYSPFSIYANDVMLMYTKICEADYKVPAYFSPPLKNLIQNLLQVNLSRRYGNLINGDKDIKYHHWFDNIDWFDILNKKVEPPYVPKVKHRDDISNFDTRQTSAEKQSAANQYADEFVNF